MSGQHLLSVLEESGSSLDSDDLFDCTGSGNNSTVQSKLRTPLSVSHFNFPANLLPCYILRQNILLMPREGRHCFHARALSASPATPPCTELKRNETRQTSFKPIILLLLIATRAAEKKNGHWRVQPCAPLRMNDTAIVSRWTKRVSPPQPPSMCSEGRGLKIQTWIPLLIHSMF